MIEPYEIIDQDGNRILYQPQERWVTPNILSPVKEEGNRHERRKARALSRKR
jgi:hypothetical protein